MSEETLFAGPRQGKEYPWPFRKGLTTHPPKKKIFVKETKENGKRRDAFQEKTGVNRVCHHREIN